MDNAASASAAELGLILRQRYPFAMQMPPLDASYNIPTEDSFDLFRKELWSTLQEWSDFWDCDDFALDAMVLAHKWHRLARRAGKGNAQSAAFGFLIYRIDPANLATTHAVNWRLDGNKRVREFEPQRTTDLTFTHSQCESVSLVFF